MCASFSHLLNLSASPVPRLLMSHQRLWRITSAAQTNSAMRTKPQVVREDPTENLDEDPLLRNFSGNKVPIIRMPQKLAVQVGKALEKKLVKDEEERRKKIANMRRPILIACKRSKYNFRIGQPGNKFKPMELASKSWAKRDSRGDFFTIKALRENPALFYPGSHVASGFDQFNLHPQLLKNIEDLKLDNCTNIQNLAIPTILHGDNVICAAETGSGKTLMYLLPMFHRILTALDKESNRQTVHLNDPRGLVLVPSRELAYQVFEVAKSLNSDGVLNIDVMIGGERTQLKLNHPRAGSVDLLIATPGILSKFLTNRIYHLSRVDMMVIDEADSLLDDSFSARLKRILLKTTIQGSVQAEGLQRSWDEERVGAQLVFVGATLPKGLEDFLDGIVPREKLKTITTIYLHRMMPHVRQTFHRTGLAEKPELVLNLVRADVHRKVSTMIFTNDTPTCDWLSRFLAENGFLNLNLNGTMQQKLRRGRFEQFRDGKVSILVCTDIASRGLDTTFVEHVINYDFPTFVSDYIHRCGRVGRIGSSASSHVTSLVSSAHEVPILQRIEEAARKTTEIHNVNANITRKINARFGIAPGDLDEKNQVQL